jgi:hypothetical protein
MLKKTEKYGRILIATTVIALTHPLISTGQNTGHDWYCSDPAAHAQYEKHLKLHLENQAETIADELEEIFSNPSLTKEQKHSKTLTILNKLLEKPKPGPGIGD